MSVPSLESLLDQHAVKYVEIDDVAVCMCGERFHDNTSPNDQPEGVMSHSDHLASVIREHGLDRVSGLNAAADVVHSEARYQWEKDARRTVCAQIVAQRMDMVERVIRQFADGPADEAEVQQ